MAVATRLGCSPDAGLTGEEDVTEDIVFGKLVVLEKDNFDGPSFKFTGNAVFGRGKRCDVRINLSFISRRHAHLYVSKQGRIMLHNITDRANATLVNDKPLEPGSHVRIHDKDTITIVDRSFRWEICPEFEVPSSNCISSLQPGKLESRRQKLLKEEKNKRRRRSEKIIISRKEKENVNDQVEDKQQMERPRSLKKPADVRKVVTPKPLLRKALATPIRIQIRGLKTEQTEHVARATTAKSAVAAKVRKTKDSKKGQNKKLALPTPIRKEIAERNSDFASESAGEVGKKGQKLALPTPIRKEINRKRKSIGGASGTGRDSKPKRALPTPVQKQIVSNTQSSKVVPTPVAKRAQMSKSPAESAEAAVPKPRRSTRKSVSKKRILPTPVRKDIAKRRKSRASNAKLKTPLREQISTFKKTELNRLYKKLGPDLQQEIRDGVQLELLMKKALNTPIRSDIQAQLVNLRKKPIMPKPLQDEIARSYTSAETNIGNAVVVSFYPRSEIEVGIESFGVDPHHYQDYDVNILQQRLDAMETELEDEPSLFDAFQGTRKTFDSPSVGSGVHWTYSDYESDSNEDESNNASPIAEPCESSTVQPKKSHTKRRKSTRTTKPQLDEDKLEEKPSECRPSAVSGHANDNVEESITLVEPKATASESSVVPLKEAQAETASPVERKPRRKSLRLAARILSSKKPATSEQSEGPELEISETGNGELSFGANGRRSTANVGSHQTSDAVGHSLVKDSTEKIYIESPHAHQALGPETLQTAQSGSGEEEGTKFFEAPEKDDETVEEAVSERADGDETLETPESGESHVEDTVVSEDEAGEAQDSVIEAEIKRPKRATRKPRQSKVATSRKTRSQSTSVPTTSLDAPKSVKKLSAKQAEKSKEKAQPEFGVGDHVKVYWEEDEKWYQGVIKSFYRKTKARVMYEDGELVLEPVADLELISKATDEAKEEEPAKRTTRSRATKKKGEAVRKSTRRRK